MQPASDSDPTAVGLPPRPARRTARALMAAALAVALGIAGCGDLGTGQGEGGSGNGVLREGPGATTLGSGLGLPPPPPGVVEVQGQLAGSVTGRANVAFRASRRRTGVAVRLRATESDESRAIAALCQGEIDVAATSRPATESELEACGSNRLELVELPVAFEAIVLITRGERTLGVDCLDIDGLRALYESGSRINSWNQLDPGFPILGVAAAGARPGSRAFDLFAERVLDEADPKLDSVRGGYRAFGRERRLERFVATAPPGAIGFVSLPYYQRFVKRLRPLAVEQKPGDGCALPSPVTISDQLYPLAGTLRLYTTAQGLGRAEVRAYLEFQLRQAPEIARKLGLTPPSAELRLRQADRIDSAAIAAAAGPGGG